MKVSTGAWNITHVVTCHHCKKSTSIVMDSKEWKRWKDGELAQNVWPYLSSDDREMIISGTHPKCWDEMYGSD